MRIGVIGHFGGKEHFNDGQTIKTVALYEALLRSQAESVSIDKVDTYFIKKNPILFLCELLVAFIRDRKFVVLLSKKGRTVLFPLLFVMATVFKKEIYHYGIGGRLAREVQAKPLWKRYVTSFKGNWLESRSLAEQLNNLGIQNAIYLPNFKRLTILDSDDLRANDDKPFRFCMFSRVMFEKGVEDAIDAVKRINELHGVGTAILDIYGQIDPGYQQRFDECIKAAQEFCKYGGVIPAEKSVEVLKDYFMLIFPTHWRHEGIPGTIIDALSAGVPVIARRWQYCDEMLEDKITGYIYPFDKPEQLFETVLYAVKHVDETTKMKVACLEKSKEYHEEVVVSQIWQQIDG